MDVPSIVWVLLVIWVGSAIGVAWFLGRRGHDPWTWLVMGVFFGPLAVLLAGFAARNEDEDLEVLAGPDDHADGRMDVLVGFDGSDESHAALRCVEHLLADRIDRLTLAHVVPFDPGWEDDRLARSLLLDEARSITGRAVGLEVVHGPPAEALTSLARRDGYHLIVVGSAARRIGSTARELVATSPVPVLVAPVTTASQPGGNHDHERRRAEVLGR